MSDQSLTLESSLSAPGEPQLASPGPLGRILRLTMGLAMLAFLHALITGWRADMWAGRFPLDDLGFYGLVFFALRFSSYVFNIMIGAAWGQRTLAVLLLGAASAGATGYVLEGAFPSVALGVYIWVWFALFCVLLGPAHLLAAALATPGCEMRSYAHLRTRLQGGGDAGAVGCGCADRLAGRTS